MGPEFKMDADQPTHRAQLDMALGDCMRELFILNSAVNKKNAAAAEKSALHLKNVAGFIADKVTLMATLQNWEI